MEFITNHLELAIIVLYALLSLLNAITSHYSKSKLPIVPIFSVILEALSILTSKDCVGIWGKIKFPFQDAPPKEDE